MITKEQYDSALAIVREYEGQNRKPYHYILEKHCGDVCGLVTKKDDKLVCEMVYVWSEAREEYLRKQEGFVDLIKL